MKLPGILFVSLLLFSCGGTESSISSAEQTSIAVSACKLSRGTDSDIGLGFPKTDGFAPASGVMNVAVLFVDFEDVPASQSVDSVFAILDPLVPDFFAEISYGRLEFRMQPHLKWLRLSKDSKYHALGI